VPVSGEPEKLPRSYDTSDSSILQEPVISGSTLPSSIRVPTLTLPLTIAMISGRLASTNLFTSHEMRYSTASNP